MARCSGITRLGERCKLEATEGSFCWSHAPENARDREARARRGGRAGGNGRGPSEMNTIRRELRELIGEVKGHQIERGDVAILVQVYNTLLRAVETEGRLKTRFDMRGEVLEREPELVAQIIDKNVHDEATRAAIIQSLDEIAMQRG